LLAKSPFSQLHSERRFRALIAARQNLVDDGDCRHIGLS
jgi:hypothetical protein